jgi:hypothetical protein
MLEEGRGEEREKFSEAQTSDRVVKSFRYIITTNFKTLCDAYYDLKMDTDDEEKKLF